MQNEEAKVRKPIFTIIAGICTGLSLICLLFVFVPSTSNLLLLTLLSPVFAIAGIVFAILANKEKGKAFWVTFIVLDIVFAISSIFAIGLAGAKTLFGGIASDAVERARERATIENVKEQIPNKNMRLYNEVTESSSYTYIDDDGKIAEQFLNMEFTLTCDSSCYGYSDYYFLLDGHELEVKFSTDFDGVVVHAIYGTFWGYGEAYKSYSIDPTEGAKIKQMIDDKINERKANYEAKEAEVKTTTNLQSAIDAIEVVESPLTLIHIDKKYEVGVMRMKDADKDMLTALKGLDQSKLTPYSGNKINNDYGFILEGTGKCDYNISYYTSERVLTIKRLYDDAYGQKRFLYVRYIVEEADGNHLMEVVQSIIDKGQPEY